MAIDYKALHKEGLSTQIAESIRKAIMEGKLVVDERLPSENELADRFNVSRPTVREALKRLAAQNLIRTQRGPTGGAFVNRLSWSEAHDALITTSTLLIGMKAMPVEDVVEARFLLEKSCAPLALERCQDEHLKTMEEEVDRQRQNTLGDEDFCASDVRFHRAFVDATGNPFLSFQMAAVIEGMQPLMNMLTYRMRDRSQMACFHERMVLALKDRDLDAVLEALEALAGYMAILVQERRSTV